VPNKVYQALALAKPVVTAHTPALLEFFSPGEHLETVRSGDAEGLAVAIARLADTPDWRHALGRGGRACMEAGFTESAIGRRLLDVLE
jgi:glycosyltransferase involved in cell wall biosynthesis